MADESDFLLFINLLSDYLQLLLLKINAFEQYYVSK